MREIKQTTIDKSDLAIIETAESRLAFYTVILSLLILNLLFLVIWK